MTFVCCYNWDWKLCRILTYVISVIQMYGKRAPWEDPSKWVADTYPWSSASLQHEWPSLLQLRPEDVGYEGYASAKEGTTSKHVPQTDTEGDPLVRFKLWGKGFSVCTLLSHVKLFTVPSKNYCVPVPKWAFKMNPTIIYLKGWKGKFSRWAGITITWIRP